MKKILHYAVASEYKATMMPKSMAPSGLFFLGDTTRSEVVFNPFNLLWICQVKKRCFYKKTMEKRNPVPVTLSFRV
jgi:hypothetical protein